MVSLNGSNYDYHFIIKELAEEFEKIYTSSGKKTKKNKTFTFPIEKKKLQELIKMDKKLQKYILRVVLQFIDSAGFKASILSNLATFFLNTQTLKMI